ncbi:hypothetical protein ES703_99374 [subsurface metagenome]
MALFMLVVIAAILVYLEQRAKTGLPFRLRRLSALDAIDEAVGRATEMGGPVHFACGEGHLTDLWAPMLIAGMSVGRHVAKKCAELGAKLIWTVNQSEAIPIISDIITTEYTIQNQLDELDISYSLRYLSDNDYAWAAGCFEIFHSEGVVSNIMAGGFSAMALPMVSVSSQCGHFQVGGTGAISQIAWFAAVCDFAIIGEDLFAAGAYLSGDPVLISNIVVQDLIKAFTLAVIVLGIVAAVLGMEVAFSKLFLW